jgi:hypothetical protein
MWVIYVYHTIDVGDEHVKYLLVVVMILLDVNGGRTLAKQRPGMIGGRDRVSAGYHL